LVRGFWRDKIKPYSTIIMVVPFTKRGTKDSIAKMARIFTDFNFQNLPCFDFCPTCNYIHTICPADIATVGSLGRRRAGQLRFGFVAVSAGHIVYVTSIVLFICSGRQLPSARQQSVFVYPKQRATVSVGSVLK
jgi:hypothetical protein